MKLSLITHGQSVTMINRIPIRCHSHPSYFLRTLFTSRPAPKPNKIRTTALTTLFLISSGLFTVYYLDSRSAIHRYFFTPLLRYTLDAETAHKFALQVLRSGLGPKDWSNDDERLRTQVLSILTSRVYYNFE